MEQKIKQDRCVGGNLRKLRMGLNMTQEQVSIQMQLQGFSMSRDYYAHIENGTYNIRTSELIGFCNVFQCDFNRFFAGLDI
ncbi:helix-turn-helix transcriptional regulator [Bengtsoniella intestinalis]|uniref:helix-turn-helix domain-containing protein n=1 Tax=Bengtsoniella intestinalis TaxID=3073143 RepID=UPI00391FB250